MYDSSKDKKELNDSKRNSNQYILCIGNRIDKNVFKVIKQIGYV